MESTPRHLRDFSSFFEQAEASAILVTDVKFDDAIFLWIFFILNLRRPKEHRIKIDVFITGIKDVAAGACMAKHVFEAAKQHVANTAAGSASPAIALRVSVSKRPAKDAPRHEADTYAPYNTASSGFPQASEERIGLQFWEDLAPEPADFVAVIAQFFNFEVVDGESQSVRKHLLNYLVPKSGGVLAFQMGFNTKVPAGLDQEVWGYLCGKVKDAAASMVFISNGWSFDKSTGKPGVITPTGTFATALGAQAPGLWRHLLEAGQKETLLFGTDQMAKYLTFMAMDGVDYEAADLKGTITGMRARAGVPDESRQSVSKHLQVRFLEARASELEVNPVLDICKELHKAASDACGEKVTEYLRRAIINFEKFGQTLEGTDGQHFAVLLQTEAPVLFPVELKQGDFGMEPNFGINSSETTNMWAAQNVNVPKSLEWMEALIAP
eukprot:TRINITY_DN25370_c0_g1_i1.p1 TRINITY_DN25370_c0_g1~~TRINITY_DN25370_c0_g1_i1.p1  ORF type:complete len:439 (-),score=97.12 TRINITY_DN25370_c0_g1_i1:128-1444(-)